MSVVSIVARPLLAGIFVASGVEVLRHPEGPAERAAPVVEKLSSTVPAVPADPVTAVRVNAAIHVVAGLSLAAGKFPRLSALLLAGTLVPTTVGGHRFWEAETTEQQKVQRTHALKNAAILGGLLYAATDRRGRPGLGWRARRSAKEARRTALALAKATRSEAHAATIPAKTVGKAAVTAGQGVAKGAVATGKASRTAGKTAGKTVGRAAGKAAGTAGKAAGSAGKAAARGTAAVKGTKIAARTGTKAAGLAAAGSAVRRLVPA